MQVARSKNSFLLSGGRVSNTCATCLLLGNNGWKRPLIPDVVTEGHPLVIKVGDLATGLAVRERRMGYQLVGVVMAHQG